MNKLLTYTATILSPTIVLWLMGSFINWELNPAHWDTLFRALMALFWLVITGFVSAIIYDLHITK